MRAGQSKGFEMSTPQPIKRNNGVPQKSAYSTIYEVTLGWILKKIWIGLQKLMVAIKYQLHKNVGHWLEGRRLSWFKIGLAAIAIFIVLKKDIQFSVNMKAPAAGAKSQNSQVTPMRTNVQELGIGNALSLGSESTAVASASDLDEQRVKIYINRFSKVAQAEMQKYGVPASIKMAQAIIESWAGQQSATLSTNNHFGVPLSNRTYNSAWENWRTHTLYMRDQYATLLKEGANYKKWAKSLQEAGYSNDRKYDQKLIEIIEKYQLYQLDAQH